MLYTCVMIFQQQIIHLENQGHEQATYESIPSINSLTWVRDMHLQLQYQPWTNQWVQPCDCHPDSGDAWGVSSLDTKCSRVVIGWVSAYRWSATDYMVMWLPGVGAQAPYSICPPPKKSDVLVAAGEKRNSDINIKAEKNVAGDRDKTKMTQPGGVHPNAWRALLRSAKRGSWSQSSFRGGAGAGVSKGTVMVGLPGPMLDGCLRVMKGWGGMREGTAEWNFFWDE